MAEVRVDVDDVQGVRAGENRRLQWRVLRQAAVRERLAVDEHRRQAGQGAGGEDDVVSDPVGHVGVGEDPRFTRVPVRGRDPQRPGRVPHPGEV